MTLLINGFEGGTSGITVTSGNSGGASGNPFDSTLTGTGATTQYDNTHAAHGGLSCQIATTGTSSSSYCQWGTSMGSQALVWFRQYLYLTANPAANFRCFETSNAGGSAGVFLRIGTGGLLTMVNVTGSATITTSTTTIPLNAWFRVEGFVNCGNGSTTGQTELRIFTSPDALTPVETNTSAANLNLTIATLAVYTFGVGTPTVNVAAWWQDDVGLSNTGYVGPSLMPGLMAAPAAPGATWLRRYHHRQFQPPPNQHFVSILPGTVTTTAAVTNQVEPIYTATATASGALTNQAGKVLAATVTSAGTMNSGISKTLAAAVTATGSLARQIGKVLAGTASTSGSLSKTVGKTLSATVTVSGSIAKGIGKVLAAAVSAVASVLPQPKYANRRVQVTITPAGPNAASVSVTPAGANTAQVAVTPAGPLAATVTITQNQQ